MFAFLVTRYHVSESTAVKRIGAARAARRFPVLFTMVAEGDIHLSGIHRLKAHLTPENHEHVLAAAKHKTIRQIEELVARPAPKPDVPSTLRALPHPTTIATTTAPTVALEQVHKRKTAATEKPRARKATTAPPRWVRSIPAAVRREVWKRDEGRCAFIGEDGHRCSETRCLEFAHLEPWAKGGATTVENVALRCIAHNAFEADRDYGASFMAHKRKSKSKSKPKPWSVREPVARYALGRTSYATKTADVWSNRSARASLR